MKRASDVPLGMTWPGNGCPELPVFRDLAAAMMGLCGQNWQQNPPETEAVGLASCKGVMGTVRGGDKCVPMCTPVPWWALAVLWDINMTWQPCGHRHRAFRTMGDKGNCAFSALLSPTELLCAPYTWWCIVGAGALFARGVGPLPKRQPEQSITASWGRCV